MKIEIDKREIWKAKDELIKRKTYSARMQFGFEEGIKFTLNQVNKLTIPVVVNCVYVVTERDNYGDQIFKGVFKNKEQAIKFLAKDGLTESNIDEINEIELE